MCAHSRSALVHAPAFKNFISSEMSPFHPLQLLCTCGTASVAPPTQASTAPATPAFFAAPSLLLLLCYAVCVCLCACAHLGGQDALPASDEPDPRHSPFAAAAAAATAPLFRQPPHSTAAVRDLSALLHDEDEGAGRAGSNDEGVAPFEAAWSAGMRCLTRVHVALGERESSSKGQGGEEGKQGD